MKSDHMIYSCTFRLMLGAALVLFAACGHSPAPNRQAFAKRSAQSTVEIPRLLDRPEMLRYGKEWDNIQNIYGAQTAELRRNPANAEARLKLAELFIQEARITGEHPHYYPAALYMLEPVVRELEQIAGPDLQQKDLLFRALSHKASVQLSLHDFAAARETAAKAIAINPYNAYIYGCLVDANVELGDYRKAVDVCDKMVGIRPDLRSYARVSYLREIYGDVNGAIEAMDMAVKAGYPGFEQTEWARLQLGHLYERYGQAAAAEKQYRMCLALRENYPFALAGLAGLEEKRHHFDRAEALLKQAAGIIPEVSFYISLAKIYRKTGRRAEAESLIAKTEDMMAEDIAAGHNMSLEAGRFQLEVTGNLDKALEFANDEYRRRPENKDVNQLLAAICMARGNKKQAAPYLQKALATGSKDPELLELKKKGQTVSTATVFLPNILSK